MDIVDSYEQTGFVHLPDLVATDVAQAFLHGLKQDMGDGAIPLSRVAQHPNLLTRPAFEVYGHHYKPMIYFLWGLTPIMCQLTGRRLIPTYDYLRVYRKGDVCRVHSDRLSCEHSLSLTLAYSDGEPWSLDIGTERQAAPSAAVDEGFGEQPFAAIPMNAGDAVLYRGVHHRHGRVTPNPNRWSAHLFLHWVDAEGAYAEHGFDGNRQTTPVSFTFS